jgi:hypothetical protein
VNLRALLTDARWRCGNCNVITAQADLLRAPNPFDADDTVHYCPYCKVPNDFERLCDIEDCERAVSNGTPLADKRYVWRCWTHRPAAMGEAVL